MPRLEEIRKAVIGFVTPLVGYAVVALDVLGESHLDTKDGVFAAGLALLSAFGIYHIPNANSRNGSFE